MAKLVRQRLGKSGKAYRISVGPDPQGGFRQWGAGEDVLKQNEEDARRFWGQYQRGALAQLFGDQQ